MSVNYVDINDNVVSSSLAISGTSIVGDADYAYVEITSGGSAEKIVISSGGSVIVNSNGNAKDIVVKDGGYITLQNGSLVSDLFVEAGGKVGGFSFGTDNQWTTAPGGLLAIGSKIVISENEMQVYRGGNASYITAENDAVINLASGAELSNTVLNSAGTLYVSGTAVDTTVNNAGFFGVTSHGDADGLVVNDGGAAFVFGDASDIELNEGAVFNGFQFTSSSFTFNNVNSGNAVLAEKISVSNGEDDFILSIASGGELSGVNAVLGAIEVSGSISDVAVYYGYMRVEAGADADNIENYEKLEVVSGGAVSNVSNSNRFDLAGSASNVTNNAVMNVSQTGNVVSMTNSGTVNVAGSASEVINAGIMNVSSNANVSDVENRNLLNVAGNASNVDNTSAGTVNINGIASDITNAGMMKVSSGGRVFEVENTGTLDVAGNISYVNNSGVMTVMQTGAANSVTNTADGTFNIAGTAHDIVNEGKMKVFGGATVYDVYNFGDLNVAENISDVVNNGSMLVSSGVSASGLINNGGTLEVRQDVTLTNFTVNDGVVTIDQNAYLEESTIITGGEVSIAPGAFINDIFVTVGNVVIGEGSEITTAAVDSGTLVLTGAVVVGTLTVNGGTVNISFETVVNDLTVANGVDINGFIFGNGEKIEHAVLENGVIYINNNEDMFITEDRLTVRNGLAVNNMHITSGYLYMENASASNTVVDNVMRVSASCKVSGTVINDSGRLYIEDSLVKDTIVNSGGAIYADNGAIVSSSIVSEGAKLFGYSGAVISSAVVEDDGFIALSEGVEGKNVIVSAGGILNLTAAADTDVQGVIYFEDGDSQSFNMINGVISNFTVIDSSVLTVKNNGVAKNTNINSGGAVYADNAGMVSAATVNSSGYLHVLEGGSASGTVAKEGFVIVSSGGEIENTIIRSGAVLNVMNGGEAETNRVSSGAVMNVAGVANTNNILKGGLLNVVSTGQAINTTVSSGASMRVEFGGSASLSYVKTGAEMSVFGSVESTDINANGSMIVNSGAEALDNEVYVGGKMDVAGGVASSNIIRTGGVVNIYDSGYAESTKISAGGTMNISNGGAYDVQVTKDAELNVSSNGGAMQVYITSGTVNVQAEAVIGNVFVSAGGLVNLEGTMLNAEIVNRGSAMVSSGAVSDNVIVSSGAVLDIAAGGTAYNTQVFSHGKFRLDKDSIVDGTTIRENAIVTVKGVISNSTVNSEGSLNINSTATHKNSLYIQDDSANVVINGTLDFTVSDVERNNTFLVNNLNLIKGVPTYTITVNENQYGDYNLAQNASSINGKNITVNVIGNDGSIDNFTLTVNGERYLYEDNGSHYELNLNTDGNLTLSIGMPAPIFSPSTLEPTKENIILTVIYPVNSENIEKYYRIKGNSHWQTYTGPIEAENNAIYEFYAKDGEYESFISEYEITNIDRIAPEVNVYGNFEDYGKSDLLLYVDVYDASPYDIEYSYDCGVTWTAMNTNSLEVSQDKHYVSFRVTDKAGNVTINKQQFSTEAAQCSLGDITPSTTEDEATNQNVVLTADATGVLLYSYDYREKGSDAEWITAVGNVVEVSKNGAIAFKAVDVYGNESNIELVDVSNIDKTAPVIEVNFSTAEITNEDVIVTVSITEEDSGIASREYSLNGGLTWNRLYGDSITVERNCDIHIKVTDRAGNETVYKNQINNIDKDEPITPVITPSINELTSSNVVLTVDYSEYAVQRLYSYDGSIWLEYNENIVIENNDTTVYVKGIDRAGNESSVASYKVSNIDKVLPELNVTGNIDQETEKPIVLTVEAYDANGIASIRYTFDNEEWFDVEYNQILVKENGMVIIQATDVVGNVTTSFVDINNIVKPEIVKTNSYNLRMLVGTATDLSAVDTMFSYKASASIFENAVYQSYVFSSAARGVLDISRKDTEDVNFELYGIVNVKNDAIVGNIIGGNVYEVNTRTAYANTDIVDTSSVNSLSVAGVISVVNSEVDTVLNYANVTIDGGNINNVHIDAVYISESQRTVNDVINIASRVENRSATGIITLRNFASAENITNYRSVVLQKGSTVSGNISFEAYSENYSNRYGIENVLRTVVRTGYLSAVDSEITGSVTGYHTVNLTGSTVQNNIIIDDIARIYNGDVLRVLTGSVIMVSSEVNGTVENYSALTMRDSFVENVSNTQRIIIAGGTNHINNYVGTNGNDVLTVYGNTVLVLGNADFGAGTDSLILHGTLVLGSAFDINAEYMVGAGDIVATNDVWQDLSRSSKSKVLNLGATTENFVSKAVETADNNEWRAAWWNLASDYNGWLSNGVDVDDNVDYIRFGNRQGGTLLISGDGFGEKDIITLNNVTVERNSDGDFVVDFAANVNNVLMLRRNEENSMSYSIALLP